MKRVFRSFLFWLSLLAVMAMLPETAFKVVILTGCGFLVALWPWVFGMTKGSRR